MPVDSSQPQAAKNYARLVTETFAHAEVIGMEEKFYNIGCAAIALRFAGKKLQPIVTPALQHLSAKPHSADFVLKLTDGVSAKAMLPFPKGDAHVPLANLCYSDENISVAIHPDTGTLNLLDATKQHGHFWANDATSLPWYEAGFPLRLIFHLWFRQRKQYFIHSAAVGTENGAALIVGKGGSGKSTTALACVEAGIKYLGDDYALVQSFPEPRVWSLYCSAKATDESLARFPNLEKFLQRRGAPTEKNLLFFDPQMTTTRSLPVRAVLWPRITGRVESRLVPASAATLLLALAPSSILQLPGAGAEDFQMLAQLLQQVPTYILEAGTDMSVLASTVKSCLE